MRIDNHYGPQAAPESGASSQPAAASTAGAHGVFEDQAQLSGARAQVISLAAQALQLPEVREERVAALRQTVQSGDYRPDSEKVAHAVLTHMIGGVAA